MTKCNFNWSLFRCLLTTTLCFFLFKLYINNSQCSSDSQAGGVCVRFLFRWRGGTWFALRLMLFVAGSSRGGRSSLCLRVNLPAHKPVHPLISPPFLSLLAWMAVLFPFLFYSPAFTLLLSVFFVVVFFSCSDFFFVFCSVLSVIELNIVCPLLSSHGSRSIFSIHFQIRISKNISG